MGLMPKKQVLLPAPLEIQESVIEANHLRVERGGKTLLKDITIDLRAGEVLALLGPNGAGKSTLLSALAGEYEPDGGNVSMLGTPLRSWNLREMSRQRSVMLQEHQLSFPFTTIEVVEMGRAPWQGTTANTNDEVIIRDSMQLAEVQHLAERRVPSLSGGERARVSFARTLATRTGVVMLDEPTAALDLKHQEALLQTVSDLAAHGMAVLVVLHDLNLAAYYATRIALLRDGLLWAVGEPQQVLTSDIISKVYNTPVEVVPNPVTGEPLVLPIR
ncbi:heme ABC transporter ATP-binding protein [Canibacter sp. lx-72]|nr:heme ABC transporter ATP-binding protein [Canibacter zhuwentaonis]MBT1018748.1 heme ABC transporter ATP-binding protein [Canibacter zhuwentaonis]